jgi:hypothetical protein
MKIIINGDTDKIKVSNDGKIGLGTSTPETKLEVKSRETMIKENLKKIGY